MFKTRLETGLKNIGFETGEDAGFEIGLQIGLEVGFDTELEFGLEAELFKIVSEAGFVT